MGADYKGEKEKGGKWGKTKDGSNTEDELGLKKVIKKSTRGKFFS